VEIGLLSLDWRRGGCRDRDRTHRPASMHDRGGTITPTQRRPSSRWGDTIETVATLIASPHIWTRSLLSDSSEVITALYLAIGTR
jgi:hypothetical protein